MNTPDSGNMDFYNAIQETSATFSDNSEYGCDPQQPVCTADVESVTEPMCDNVNVTPSVISPGPVFVKTPVVLAETRVLIPVVADIKLEANAFEIKRIKKNVYITQCYLLPNSADGFPNTGILFLEGFVRKNIEYATRDCESTSAISGRIHHTTVKVPFRCNTRVTFLRPPIFNSNPVTTELDLFEDTLRNCDICSEPIIGKDPCLQNFFNTENFNERVFCELVKANISEADIHRNPTTSCVNPTEQVFREFTEKMLIDITVKVLQKQQVRLTATCV